MTPDPTDWAAVLDALIGAGRRAADRPESAPPRERPAAVVAAPAPPGPATWQLDPELS